MSYQKIDVQRVAGALGAEVEGIDLSSPLDQETLAEIQQAWLEYLVLFFRDQELSPDQFKKFISNFGELKTFPFLSKIEGDNYVERLDLAEEPATAPPTTTVPTAQPPQPAAQVKTYNLQGGSTAISFAPGNVSVVWANPNPGYTVKIENESPGIKVEFESDEHESRIDAWWDGGPRERIREKD